VLYLNRAKINLFGNFALTRIMVEIISGFLNALLSDSWRKMLFILASSLLSLSATVAANGE
jgi:hypothetical protein